MKQLDAIAEIHPVSGLHIALQRLYSPERALDELYELVSKFQSSTTFESSELKIYLDSLVSRSQKDERYKEFATRLFKRVHEVLLLEDTAIQNYQTIFMEGISNTLQIIGERAKSLNKRVIYLDDNNPHYTRYLKLQDNIATLFGGNKNPNYYFLISEASEARDASESEWVKTIASSYMPNSLMIAGIAHIRNEFFLREKLLGDDIQMNILNPEFNIDDF